MQQFERAVLLTDTSLHFGEHFQTKLTDAKAGKGRRRFAKQVHTITESILKIGKIQQQLSDRVKDFSQYGLLRRKLLPVCITGHFYVQKGGDRSNTSHFDGLFSQKPNPSPLSQSDDPRQLTLVVLWLRRSFSRAARALTGDRDWSGCVSVTGGLDLWHGSFWAPRRHFCLLTRYCNFYSTLAALVVYVYAEEAVLVVSCRGIAWRAHAHTIREHACTHALFSIFRWQVLKAAVCMSVSSTSCLHYIISVARDTGHGVWIWFRQLVLFFLLHTCYWDNLSLFFVCVVCVGGWGSFSSPNYHWCCYCDWSSVSPGLHLVSVFTPAPLEFLRMCTHTHAHTCARTHTQTHTHTYRARPFSFMHTSVKLKNSWKHKLLRYL